MHIEFREGEPSEISEGNMVTIGLTEAETTAKIVGSLTVDSEMDAVEIASLSRAVGRAIYDNNRRLQIDIEAAFRYLKD
jgi:hypothetical protein